MENKRVFTKTTNFGVEETEIIILDIEDIFKRYYVGDRTLEISLEDKNVEIAPNHVTKDVLDRYAYADEHADTEAWRYVWEYIENEDEGEQLTEMIERLMQVAFDPRDCEEEEFYIRWDGSNNVDEILTEYSEHDWFEVTEDWEDAEELNYHTNDVGTYTLMQLKDGSRYLIATDRYAGSLDTLYKTKADTAAEALEKAQEAAREQYYR